MRQRKLLRVTRGSEKAIMIDDVLRVVGLFTVEGYDTEYDEEEGCVLVVRELDGKVVAKIRMEVEVLDDSILFAEA